MAVGFTVKYYWYSVGTGDFLHAFFSTIAYNLEGGKWGSRYPVLMNRFYSGNLEVQYIKTALKELDKIEKKLKHFAPDAVVWDIEDLSKQPPWGNDISSDITDLSNYFVTSDGENLIEVLRSALLKGQEVNTEVKISTL